MTSDVFLLLPPCCIALTLIFVNFAIAGATWHKSRIYAFACVILTGVLLIDFILNAGILILALKGNESTGIGYCFAGTSVIAIETCLLSIAALSLFHRRKLVSILIWTGLMPTLFLLVYAGGNFIAWRPRHGSLLQTIDAFGQSHIGESLFYLIIPAFLIATVASCTMLIISLRRYRRQINSYFAFHEKISANVLTSGTVVYICFICMQAISITDHIGLDLFPSHQAALFVSLYSRAFFFIFTTVLVVRFHRRYFSIESALDTLDEIDKTVENVTVRPSHRANATDGFPAPASDAQVANTLRTPELAHRLSLWENDPKRHFLRDDINMLSVAEMLQVKPRLLSEYLNTVKQINFSQYINTLRIEEAQRMIAGNANLSFTDIAYATGFTSLSSFCRVFKRVTGTTPSQFKEQKDV